MRSIFDQLLTVIREAEQACIRPSGPGTGLRKVAVVCVTAALCLGLVRYLNQGDRVAALLSSLGAGEFLRQWDPRLARLTGWAAMMVLFYLLLPMVVVKAVLREDLRDYGWRLSGIRKDLPLYGGLLIFMLVLVTLFSGTAVFQAQYPFYSPQPGQPLWPGFWAWEALYMLQFVAVEFFFRGFLVHGLKERLGFAAVLVMTMPYCMIHAAKPLPEMLGSIPAGLVLGLLSLKSRSIVPGVLLHGGVALAMDLAALWRKGALF